MRKYTFIGILILMAGLGAACEDQLSLWVCCYGGKLFPDG